MPRLRIDWTAILVVAAAGLLVLLLLGGTGAAPASRFVADPVISPGALNPDVTPETLDSTVCVSGWTATIRPPSEYTAQLKVEQLRAYGFPGKPEDYQQDHLISLGLGGHPTDPRNFWPEPYPRAREVDTLERELHDRLCAREMSLEEVQREILRVKQTEG
jgi:hypothetical protein